MNNIKIKETLNIWKYNISIKVQTYKNYFQFKGLEPDIFGFNKIITSHMCKKPVNHMCHLKIIIIITILQEMCVVVVY